ncbi:unnamed protein product [Urochloa humidicola]
MVDVGSRISSRSSSGSTRSSARRESVAVEGMADARDVLARMEEEREAAAWAARLAAREKGEHSGAAAARAERAWRERAAREEEDRAAQERAAHAEAAALQAAEAADDNDEQGEHDYNTEVERQRAVDAERLRVAWEARTAQAARDAEAAERLRRLFPRSPERRVERSPERRAERSPERHGGHFVRTIVKDSGSSPWPVLTKTNYAEWSLIMKVKLQAREMWDAVKYGDVGRHEDRRALEALVAAVPPELGAVLATKLTAKDAWDAIAAARIGSEHARRSTLQKLRQDWERLAFQPGEDIDDFALRLSGLMQQLKQCGDEDITEERAVEKFLRAAPKKYKQIALAVETLLDLSELTIEGVAGRLKAVDNHDEEDPPGGINIGGRLYLTEEQWHTREREKKKDEKNAGRSGRSRKKTKTPRPHDGAGSSTGSECEDDTCHRCGKTGHWARDCKEPRHGGQPRRGGRANLVQVEDDDEPALF